MSEDEAYYAKTPYAIRLKSRGRWYIAVKSPASHYGNGVLEKFGIHDDDDVWSDPETTGFLCVVGEEAERINLDEPNR